MTTFILAPASRVTADQVLPTPAAMLDAGLLVAYSERANGTTRRLELCPVGSTRRDTAEWVSERLDDGATVRQVAQELHVSTSVVRRYLLALELTEEIEAGDWDDVWAATQGLDQATDTMACDPHSACAVHGDGTTVAADQDCPAADGITITVTV